MYLLEWFIYFACFLQRETFPVQIAYLLTIAWPGTLRVALVLRIPGHRRERSRQIGQPAICPHLPSDLALEAILAANWESCHLQLQAGQSSLRKGAVNGWWHISRGNRRCQHKTGSKVPFKPARNILPWDA